MSRYVTVQTKLRDYGLVIKVLKEDLKAGFEEGSVKGRRALTIRRDAADLRLVENDSGWLEAKGQEETLAHHRTFLNQLQQSYAKRKIVELAKRAGFSITSEKVGPGKAIMLEVTKWS